MKIELSIHDPIIELLVGEKQRMYKGKLEFEPWYNKKINRYLQNKFRTLSKYAETQNPKFWSLANVLMQSTSYKLSGLYAVYPTWQRHLPLTKVQREKII